MDNKEIELEENEKYKKDAELRERFKNKFNRKAFKKRKNIKIFLIFIVIILIYLCWYSLERSIKKVNRENEIESIYGIEVQEKSVETNLKGYGFLSYTTDEIPSLEIHALRYDDVFLLDIEARIYKYFFEQWENENKDKFIVEENYDDYTYGLITKENWILNYKTYIEVTNYDEMLEATELIIDFKNYMGYSNIIFLSYIKYEDDLILPHNVYPQTDNEIMQSAINQWMNLEL